jgi:hypothetical protein
MDEDRFGVRVFIISLAALVISTLPFTLTLLEKSKGISIESCRLILFGKPVGLFLWGWIPGLGLAVFSLFMVRRSQDLLVKIFVWIISPLAIIAALLWLMWFLFLSMFHW